VHGTDDDDDDDDGRVERGATRRRDERRRRARGRVRERTDESGGDERVREGRDARERATRARARDDDGRVRVRRRGRDRGVVGGDETDAEVRTARVDVEVFVPARREHGADGDGARRRVSRAAVFRALGAEEVESGGEKGARGGWVVRERWSDVDRDVWDEKPRRGDSAGFRGAMLARRRSSVGERRGAAVFGGRRRRAAREKEFSQWAHVDVVFWICVLFLVPRRLAANRSRGRTRVVEVVRGVGAHRFSSFCGIDSNSRLLASLGGRRRGCPPRDRVRLRVVDAQETVRASEHF